MNIKLLTEHHLEFLSLEGGCTGLSESSHVKMSHCWKSHVTAHSFISVISLKTGNNEGAYLVQLGTISQFKCRKLNEQKVIYTHFYFNNLI